MSRPETLLKLWQNSEKTLVKRCKNYDALRPLRGKDMVIRSLGYADSRLHNWATDLAAGVYTLLSVVIISRLMAIFLTN
jgi:hypothetical protein